MDGYNRGGHSKYSMKVHIIFVTKYRIEYNPNVSVSYIVKQLKQYSANQMWKHNEMFLSKQYWKHHVFWSDGYFACSIGQVSQEIIEQYIQSQG